MPYKDKRLNNISKMRWWRDRMDTIICYLGGKCVYCGAIDDLEIDHINPKDKKFNIAHHADRNEKFLMDEIDKCQILCHDCHMQKTIIDRGELPVHCGTNTAYSQGCRCNPCKKAHSEYNKNYYRRTKCRTM